MHKFTRLISFSAHEEHSPQGQSCQVRSCNRALQERLRGDERLGSTVNQLPCKLLGRVRRVRGARDAASPVEAKVDDRDIDAIWGEEGEDVSALPLELVLEALAELFGELSYLFEIVRSACLGFKEESYSHT